MQVLEEENNISVYSKTRNTRSISLNPVLKADNILLNNTNIINGLDLLDNINDDVITACF